MDDIYGPIRKAPLSLALFVVPACTFLGGAVALAAQETDTISAAFGTPTVLISAALALVTLIWGGIFISKPVVTLTPEAVILTSGQSLLWADVTSAEAGQTTASVASANTGPRNVVHEVVRLHHTNGDITKIVTTWAKVGPQAANDRILAAFDRR